MKVQPQIQIRQQYAQIGIDADPGTWEMKQPQAALEIQTEPLRLEITSPPGELTIDQSRARAALGLEGNLEWSQKIYSQSKEIALQGVARRAQEGNRMAAIHKGGNVIAEIARESRFRESPMDVREPASFDNVDIEYVAHKPDIVVIPGQVQIEVQPHRPELSYNRGKLDIYMRQYNSVQIIPPQLDLQL
ncbi:hypothetical protein J31TS4_42660 [Paenibacillus sp. J31TS4]|uniref:DUF6470 family protein n=1 Tax=Paenibacillus sp. J31TS4 TaxID=2807195 RepID=UPI001B0DD3EE|nr:DUF6470 family protein [Paenibacillus sp. J31TS4]GIP40986.1 hypothetical protein J31TS4_42660 [Paenibacillus sp. J31TS4]